MSFPGRLVKLALFLILAATIAWSQQATTAIQFPDGRTTQLTFTTIDVPDSGFTGVQGINTIGDMVGYYTKKGEPGIYRPFLLSGENFKLFAYPGVIFGGINDSGLITGYTIGDPLERCVLYNGQTFKFLRDGDNSATTCWGINNAGFVVGGSGSTSGTRGFEMRGRQFKDVSPPGIYVYIYATGINNFGDVVGWVANNTDDGFLYRQGAFRRVHFPGSTDTEALDINDDGVIVGWYDMPGPVDNGFAVVGGQYISIAYPGAAGTFAKGINSLGQIVGEYTLDFVRYHGFVTTALMTPGN